MGQINLSRICGYCNGAGKRTYNSSPGGPLVTEDPCTFCGGDGRILAPNGIDDTLIQQIIATLAEHTSTVGDILDKVTNIKNKVKDVKDETKDIKDLCQEILDKLNE